MRASPLVLMASCLVSCALVASTDDYDATEHAFAVTGVVDGLGSATVTLLLNGGNAVATKDGRFAFPPVLVDRAPYSVTIREQPEGHACTLEHAAGAITEADVADVGVHCASTDAALDALAISAGALTPAFNRNVRDYTVDLKVPSTLFAAPPVAVTLVAQARDPASSIAILGVPTKSGTKSAPITLARGLNPVDVTVHAADPTSPAVRYHVGVNGSPSDYLKPSNSAVQGQFGSESVLEGDTLAVGAPLALSKDVPVGAVYIFTRKNGAWSQTAILEPPNPTPFLHFGGRLALKGDTLVVAANGESGKSTGVNGDPTPDPTFAGAGAVFVYVRGAGGTWSQQAYLKASNTAADASFGYALGFDGNTLAVGAFRESSVQPDSGAVYVFTRSGSTWSQQGAPLKAPTPTRGSDFGTGVTVDGDTIATIALPPGSSAVYIFTRSGGAWAAEQPNGQPYLQLPYTFNAPIALSKGTLVIGTDYDSSAATGIGGSESDTSAPKSGAVFVYTGSGASWTKQAYIKASNTHKGMGFGSAFAFRGDTLAVGAYAESSGARGVDGDQASTSIAQAGAVYFFTRSGSTWSQKHYVKASNPQPGAFFGSSLALSENTLVVGAQEESSKATGVNGKPQNDSSIESAGAVYVF